MRFELLPFALVFVALACGAPAETVVDACVVGVDAVTFAEATVVETAAET